MDHTSQEPAPTCPDVSPCVFSKFAPKCPSGTLHQDLDDPILSEHGIYINTYCRGSWPSPIVPTPPAFAVDHKISGERWLWVAPALSVASIAYVLCVYLSRKLLQELREDGKRKMVDECTSDLFDSSYTEGDGTEFQRDSIGILTFKIIRALSVLALLSLQIYEFADASSTLPGIRLCFYIYATLLSFLAIACPWNWRDALNRQLTILLFVDFLVFAYIDVWPYATYYLEPYDAPMSSVTWARVGLLTLSGFAITLTSPRPARRHRTSDEDTVSLLSRILYAYLDRIVFRAWRVPTLGIEDLPDVSDQYKSEELRRRAFLNLDPTLLGRRRYLLWGMLRVFKKEYMLLFFWSALENISEFSEPLGMKNVLSYVETGVSPMGAKPWVWILVLGLGPMVTACFQTQYYFVGTRMNLKCDSIFTQLVYEHSIRIRLKSDALPSKDDAEAKKDKEGQDSGKDAKGKGPASTTPVGDGSQTLAQTKGDGDSDTVVEDSAPVPEGGHVKAQTKNLVGKIHNLMTTDVDTIKNSYQAVTLPTAVMQGMISIWFLYDLLGWSAFVALGAIIITMPLPTYFGKLMMSTQKDKMNLTDKRIQGVTETLGVLRMIKLFAWEPHVLKDLAHRREEEVQQVQKGRVLDLIMRAFNALMPLLARLTTIITYAVVAKGELTASRMFSALVVFSMMTEQVFRIMYRVPDLIRSKVAWDRFDEFFNHTEVLRPGIERQSERETHDADTPFDEDAIGFNMCTFSWDSFKGVSEPIVQGGGREQFFLRFDSELLFKRNAINIIVGPTGSGKTSILMALLGEMYYKPDNLGSWCNLPKKSGIAYAAQESWVLNETIRYNILLGEPYDEERYKKVLIQCSLERDLMLWEAGDLTEVGEKGLTLSGGQKARVTLARALYSKASILLLDDVLAALDVHTARWVVEKAFEGDLVKGRTIILVTHNIALTAPIADSVIVLGRNGTVTSHGTVMEVLQRDFRLRRQAEDRSKLDKGFDILDKEVTKDDTPESEDKDKDAKTKGKLVVAEEKAIGRVKWAAIKVYVDGIGSSWMWILILSTFFALEVANISQRAIMGYWTSQYDNHSSGDVPLLFYLFLYSASSIIELLIDILGAILWVYRTLRASRVIHARLMDSLFSATFRWLDITPVGRIITRSTQDIDAVDGPFTTMMRPFLQLSIGLFSLFVTSVIMAGWSAFIPGVILVVLGGSLGRIYVQAQIGIRREMSNAKAPVLSQVSTVLGGIISVRAYSAQVLFRKELMKRIDRLMQASLTYFDLGRWVSVRFDSLGGIFAATVTVYFVYGSTISAGFIGFTLSIIFQFSREILSWVRIYSYVEVQSNSLERIRDFLIMDHEPSPTVDGQPPAYWPASGSLRVEHLSARYSDDSPEILHDVSFEILAGERVGVVGRTGAGKSSITLALLRAIKTSGKVYYDGINTENLNLTALRSNITLIPQQPELMHGTLRENLDPFGRHDDGTLHDALQVAGLFNTSTSEEHTAVSSSSDIASASTGTATPVERPKRIGLDTLVESGGTNFSLGQRQIIALARALVRRSKLLILDEATAAIDNETDTTIQKTLRTEFGKDTTLIIIAHRLQTIMDADKIMVLDAGRVVEFDSPQKLLSKEGGLLRAMVDDSDDRELLLKMIGLDSDTL